MDKVLLRALVENGIEGAADISTGNEANRDTAPHVNQTYFAVDTKKLYYCKVDGTWIEFVVHEEETTGIHGVGISSVASLDDIANDIYLSVEAQDAITKRHNHVNKSLLDTYDQINTDLEDAVIKKHSHINQTLLDSYLQTEIDLEDAVSKKHEHVNQILLDTYVQTELDLSDAVSKKHEHVNQALLDDYDQTNVDLEDAVTHKGSEGSDHSDVVSNTLASHDGDAQDIAIGLKLDTLKLVVYNSNVGAGGAASEAMTVIGLEVTDTILAITQKTAGTNSTAIIGFNTLIADGLTIVYTADPGAGSIITVLVKKV